ncbi:MULTISPECIES: hypothetical protein [unclassified Paraburkholderia]|uniref:hypothetical protein n=1 Tax=unclassified Paraburkholderia TaxID=2615204 RepID=UPI001794E516|nr:MULTISPECIES: hypothetical protein [unclassified Paraburkholderia]MBB5441604.1 hypothetical protein [Paraburkholderia sp. WSM4177]MBB5481999.1 hypothetical protein [Paraburkholderia sp. WSM4180]
MEKLTMKTLVARVAVASLCVCAATLAQAGGNGNGGNGSGGAHGAATAGMTYHGDPVTSPLDAMPGHATQKMDAHETDMRPMSPDDAMSPAKTGQ